MEITMAVIGLFVAGFALMFGLNKTCYAILAALWLGPVAWKYAQTQGDSMVYEALFRIALTGITLWAAQRMMKFDCPKDK